MAYLRTQRERAEEKRQEKLTVIREQVEDGSLVIRQMTNEERRRYAPQRSTASKIDRRRK